jgi:probable rRNA maturation factor
MSGEGESLAGPEIAVLCPAAAWQQALPAAETVARRAAEAALAGERGAEGDAGVELCIVLADDALLGRLNRDYRGKDGPTNVLSFPSGEAISEPAGRLLGDVVLAFETCAREAATQGKRLEDHLRHLTVHGVLHLLGYDHESDDEAAAMEAQEISILAELGVGDPYAADSVPRAESGR